MNYLHRRGIFTAANLHDANGVGNYDAMFPQMCAALGLNPSDLTSIPFSMVNKSYVYALEDIVLQPVENMGMDFWWIDWQQGGTPGGCDGDKQNPTIWTDKIRSTDSKRRGSAKRNLVLARWGGLGNHRYPVGFSGDVDQLTWTNLAFQPYFSMTGTNVGYGVWSHDTEGPWDDYEMYTRWIQWSAYSGVFRSHDRGMSGGDCADTVPSTCSIVKVWDVPTPYFEANRDALLTRSALVPYIYTAFRQAFDSGLSIIRPMYYDFPELEMAYAATPDGAFGQYMFGDDLLVSPVTTKFNSNTSMAAKEIWLPPGAWVEKDTGVVYDVQTENFVLQRSYALNEVPVFARGGAVIPNSPIVIGNTVGQASQPYAVLNFDIYPWAPAGSTQLYEDDGSSTAYTDGKSFAWTSLSYNRTTSAIFVSIVTEGHFPELPPSRIYCIRIVNGLPAASASVNGNEIYYNEDGGTQTWSFDGNQMLLTVCSGSVPPSTVTQFDIQFMDEVTFQTASGIKGMVLHSNYAKVNLDQDRSTLGSNTPDHGNLMASASTGEALSYLAAPATQSVFAQTLQDYPALFALAVEEVQGMTGPRVSYSAALLSSASNPIA